MSRWLLTSQQEEIVVMTAQGSTRKGIGLYMGISVKTVDHHMLKIGERLGFSDVAGLTRWALQMGLISLPDIRSIRARYYVEAMQEAVNGTLLRLLTRGSRAHARGLTAPVRGAKLGP